MSAYLGLLALLLVLVMVPLPQSLVELRANFRRRKTSWLPRYLRACNKVNFQQAASEEQQQVAL